MPVLPALFQTAGGTYKADTCEPLKAAVTRGEARLVAVARRSYPGKPLPARRLVEICTAGFWDAPKDQRWGLDWHRNEGIELTYLDRGKLGFAVDGQTCALRRGDLTVTRPWQLHRVGLPEVTASRLYWLILDVGVRRPHQPWRWPKWLVCSPQDLARLTRLLRHNEQPVWQAGGGVGECFRRLGACLELADASARETRLRLHINEVLIALLELLQRKRITLDESLSSSQRTVELFLAELPKHIEHEWDLETMAEQCGLGRSRFAWHCRQLTNLTPLAFLTRCRVEAAVALLRGEANLNITEIALRCGFQSSQYFATVFRRQMRQTPRACVREARKAK